MSEKRKLKATSVSIFASLRARMRVDKRGGVVPTIRFCNPTRNSSHVIGSNYRHCGGRKRRNGQDHMPHQMVLFEKYFVAFPRVPHLTGCDHHVNMQQGIATRNRASALLTTDCVRFSRFAARVALLSLSTACSTRKRFMSIPEDSER